MIGGLRSYPEMKQTGLPWLGEMPAHWQLRRIKTLLKEIDRRTKSGEERLLSLRMRRGLIDHHDAGGKPIPAEALIGFKVIEPGQVVMNRMRAAYGLFAVADSGGLVSPDYAVFNLTAPAYQRYLIELFKLPSMALVFRSESKGLGTGESGFLRLYTDRFGSITISYPPLDEQRLIVRFLDWHGAQTAKLIRAKKKLIALLNEQKQAIICRAVTRGLESNAIRKPSGIPWLGEIPAGWDVTRLRNISRKITSGSRGWSRYAADHGPLFVRIANLSRTGLHLRFDDVVRLALPTTELGEAARTRAEAGDLLLSITAYIGSVAIVPDDVGEAYVSQHVACCRLNTAVNPRWIGYVLLSPIGQTHGTLSMYGGTKQGLSLDDVKNYVVLLPPRVVQDEIVDWIDSSTRRVSDTITSVEKEIVLLQEFRNRLIADVVTGKLDVRAAAAATPDITERQTTEEALEDEDAELDFDQAETKELAA